MAWVDAHCHLQERYRDDDAAVRTLLERARAADVAALVVIGTDAGTSREAIDLATAVAEGTYGPDVPAVRAVVGLHPHDAVSGTAEIAALAAEASPHLAGIGEAGLDYFYDHSPRDVQRQAFAEQIALAHAHDLALIIHARDAWDDLFAVLGTEGVPRRTVLHCFTGGPDQAEACVERGMWVSFSGIISFPKAPEVRDACTKVPLGQLLVETDAPFLAPVPHRGKQNEPSFVPVVGAAVAAARGDDVAEIARATAKNAEQVFGFKGLNLVSG